MEGSAEGKRQGLTLDTGFFVSLMRGAEKALEIFENIKHRKLKPVVPSIVVGEFLFILFREGRKRDARRFLKDLSRIARVADIDLKTAEKGARIKYGLGIPFVDALIVACAIENRCGVLVTSDRMHMKRAEGLGLKVLVI